MTQTMYAHVNKWIIKKEKILKIKKAILCNNFYFTQTNILIKFYWCPDKNCSVFKYTRWYFDVHECWEMITTIKLISKFRARHGGLRGRGRAIMSSRPAPAKR
jgi:hypothetical protein